MEFFMAMVPPTVTHQEKQVRVVNGKPKFYEPQELKAARSKLEAHLAQHKPDQKYTGPVELVSTWCFPREITRMESTGSVNQIQTISRSS